MAPSAPGFWLNETSGKLRPVVAKYLGGDDLTIYEVSVLRAYFAQWIKHPSWKGGDDLTELRAAVDKIFNRRDVEEWLELAQDLGIDPL